MELSTPIRIYWDLPLATGGGCDVETICEQILATKVLAVDLLFTGEVIDDRLWEALQRFQGQPVAVSLTASKEALSAAARVRIAEVGVKNLLVSSDSLAELKAVSAGYWAAPAGTALGVSFRVTEKNYLEIPELFRFCQDNGIPRLVFPIQRAQQGDSLFHLTPERRDKLAAELGEQGLPAKLQLTVHDPFLWKTLYPGLPFPEGGCQAGNSMLYVAPDAAVYPCPIMPYRLGVLGSATLSAIAFSAEKKQLRQRLLTSPADCLACPDLAHCLGGCRGRGYLPKGCWDAADPSCGCTP